MIAMGRVLASIALVLLSTLAVEGQTSTSGVVKTPLPLDLKIEPADSTVPSDVAAFSGTWVGEFNTNPRRDATVVIYKIHPMSANGKVRADFIYSWGAFGSGAYESQRPGYIAVNGEIKNGELIGQYGRVSLRFRREAGNLAGTWQTNNGFFQGSFLRAQ